MNTEILGVALQVILMVVLAYPLGKDKNMVGLHEAGREIDIQSFRYQSTGGDELETVLESIVDIECFLVCVGHGTAGYSTLAASEP